MSKRRIPDEVGIAGILLLVVVVMSVLSPNFLTGGNISVLLLNGCVVALLALGQTFVLLTGGIDLSTGSNLALTGMVAALVMRSGVPWWLAAVAAMLVGILVGVINAVFIHFIGLPPFIATFSMFGVAGSLPLILTGSSSITVADPMFAFLGRGSVFEIPVPILIVAIVAVIFAVVLSRTSTGVHIYALGGNKETARLAGINTGRTTMFVYAISGLCAALAGIVTTSRLMVGYPSAGSGNELFYSIAAAVVGGVSLFGGVGTIGGALFGALLIATVSNGMNVVGVNSFWQPLVIGVIILAGVSLDTYRRRIGAAGAGSRLARLFRPSGRIDGAPA
ncbi:ABC transporter permease [Salana multivorans]